LGKGQSPNGIFSIQFEFESRLLPGMAGRAFEKVMLQMADAFEARAQQLSGAL
jgi:ribosome-associated toxin RatA of RatAB toxin-antitoxin module